MKSNCHLELSESQLFKKIENEIFMRKELAPTMEFRLKY